METPSSQQLRRCILTTLYERFRVFAYLQMEIDAARYRKISLRIVLLGIIWVWGCATVPKSGPPAVPVVLEPGAPVAVVEAWPGLLGPTLHLLREPVVIEGIQFVAPPETGQRFSSVDELAGYLAGRVSAKRIVTVSPETVTEMTYNPEMVPVGVMTEMVPAGSPGGKPVRVPNVTPATKITYRNSCRRTVYRLRIFDGTGRPMGETLIRSADFQPCPDTSETDIHFDDFQYVIAWLKTNLHAR